VDERALCVRDRDGPLTRQMIAKKIGATDIKDARKLWLWQIEER
jgi:hypothetical protein